MKRLTTVLFVVALALGLGSVAQATPPTFNGNIVTQGTPVYSVIAYGVKGASTVSAATALGDQTAAISSALSAAAATCGTVIGPPEFVYTTGTLTIPTCVTLEGTVPGPYPNYTTNAQTTPMTLTLLATAGSGSATGTSFITLEGGSHIQHLVIYYPNQVSYTAATPTAYPWTVSDDTSTGAFGTELNDVFMPNCYQCVRFHGGQNYAKRVDLGAYLVGFRVEGSSDGTFFKDTHIGTYWDILNNVNYPQTIDSWVESNRTGYQFTRADFVDMENCSDFGSNIAVDLNDDGTATPDASYGIMNGCYLEKHHYGIHVLSTQANGWQIVNTSFITNDTAPINFDATPGGQTSPAVTIIGGVWLGAATPTVNGGFTGYWQHMNVYGYDACATTGDLCAFRGAAASATGGALKLGGSGSSCQFDYGVTVGSQANIGCDLNAPNLRLPTGGALFGNGVPMLFNNGNLVMREPGASGNFFIQKNDGSANEFIFDNSGNETAQGKGSFGAHNGCSSSSGWPCETSGSCALSAATTCNFTVTVPAGSVCTATSNGSDTTTVVESWKTSLSTNTLTVTALESSSQTATAAANIGCK